MWIGIDPGKSGALAHTTPGGKVVTSPLPLIQQDDGKQRLDGNTLHKQLVELIELGALSGFPALQPQGVVIEQVTGLPGQSTHNAFTFGMTCGVIYQAVVSTGLPVFMITPQVWRAKLGVHSYARRHSVTDTKGASRAVANELWPDSAHQWIKKTKVDHAEAALLAEYGRRFCVCG